MVFSKRFKYNFVEICSVLFIFLFIYAASGKLFDYQKFRVQLGQSPILTHFATLIAWIIPGFEIAIAVFLALPSLRIVGLFAFFSLMVMFTSYIIAITRFSEYIPCSCGGVLQHMNWNQHLIFNLFFVILSVICILLYQPYAKTNFIAIESGHAENL